MVKRGGIIHSDFQLPEAVGHRGAVTNVREMKDGQALITFNSYLTPDIHGLYDPKVDQVVQNFGKMPQLLKDKYVVSSSIVRARDGESIPVTVIRLREQASGPMPTYMHFYGNAANSLLPKYTPKLLAFIEHFKGQVVVVAPRGGDEEGHQWMEKGRAGNRMATFQDMIDVAENLIASGETTAGQLVLNGRSAGGYNTLAIANLRPDLFAAVTPQVPLSDLLRYHLPSMRDGGLRWVWEYGAATTAQKFRFLKSISPIHSLPSKAYPPIILFASDSDDRVNPTHSYEFMAELQSRDIAPIALLRVAKNGFHTTRDEAEPELLFLSTILPDRWPAASRLEIDMRLANTLAMHRANKDEFFKFFAENDQLGKLLGGRLVELTSEECVYEYQALPAHHNPNGILHGGALYSVMDSSQGAFVHFTLDSQWRAAATGTATIRYEAPVKTGKVRIRTFLKGRDGRKIFVRSEAHDEAGKLLASLEEVWIAIS